MNAGTIWWRQVGTSLRLLEQLVEALRDCRSAVLHIPSEIPFRETFYEELDFRRAEYCAEKRMKRLPWTENSDPGQFVLNELCSDQVRADYWPGQSCAAYLGSRDDITLCDRYVWVTGIHSRSDLQKWVEFVSEYRNNASSPSACAVFYLEYDGASAATPMLEELSFTVESYDCRVFALEAAAALQNTELRSYQAELALSIAEGDPELCFALLESGSALLRDPVGTAVRISRYTLTASGCPHRSVNEMQAQSAAWKAAIVLLFPVLEQYRMDFIAKHEAALSRHLPISESNGERVDDPYDLELGSLSFIISSSQREFGAAAAESARLCRKVRNLLAHNKVVPLEDVGAVLRLSVSIS